MELACIAKLGRDPSSYRLKWKSYEGEDDSFVTEDRTLDVRLLNSCESAKTKTRKRARIEDETGLNDGKEHGVDCKGWHENNLKKRLVFIGGEAILTDQEVVVYEIEDEVFESDINESESDLERDDDARIPVHEEIEEEEVNEPYRFTNDLDSEPPLPLSELLKCLVCLKRFETVGDYSAHIESRLAHPNKKARKQILDLPFSCCVFDCDFVTPSGTDFIDHIDFHHNKFHCRRCWQDFGNESDLEEHQRLDCKYPPSGNVFFCTKCRRDRNGKTTVFANHYFRTRLPCFDIVSGRICRFCKKEFASFDQLLLHEKERVSLGPFACCICWKKIPSSGGLNMHVARHQEPGEFYCEVCDVRMPQAVMKRHVKNHKVFRCKYCEFKSVHKTYLEQHYLRKHMDEYRADAEEHQKVKVREYKCADCQLE